MTIFHLLLLVFVYSTEITMSSGTGQYDELLLALQWPTSYCNTGENKCDHYPIPPRFTVHGLWHNKNSKCVACIPDNRILFDKHVCSLSLLRLRAFAKISSKRLRAFAKISAHGSVRIPFVSNPDRPDQIYWLENQHAANRPPTDLHRTAVGSDRVGDLKIGQHPQIRWDLAKFGENSMDLTEIWPEMAEISPDLNNFPGKCLDLGSVGIYRVLERIPASRAAVFRFCRPRTAAIRQNSRVGMFGMGSP